MRSLYTGLALWNLLVLVGYAGLAVAHVVYGVADVRTFQMAGFFMAFFCCLVHSLLIVHFIGSMKWIQQSGPTAGLDDTRALRRAWVKGPMFTTVTCAMLLSVAVAILAGGAATGALPAWIPLVLAMGNVALNAGALRLARTSLAENRTRQLEVQRTMEERIAAGLVREEESQALLPESGRAGGKVFVFLAVNVWVLYVYLRYVLRDPTEPVLPYVAASIVLAFVGLWMLRAAGAPQAEQ